MRRKTNVGRGVHASGSMCTTKSVLGRVRNCMGEQALHCEMVASSFVCQLNHSYAESMFRLHSDHTRGCVVAGVLLSVYPTKGLPYSIIHRLVATQFS